ncbi:hypothetical protein ACXR8U_21635 [Methylobacterium radiotolerans]|jgi:hypothetical protein|uniref:hypothetical protein n=1 Tax=Methylobacterium radiotolerans TaxID=31998 RepID=UPI000B77776E|nr:hypothetical protein [Methylobacterium radiotolerans]OXE42996.1 hypothetical protein CCS92_06795 [Methylobacterium radiotolerans]
MAFSSDDIQIILQYFMEQLPEDKLAELDARIDGTATEHPAMDAALAKKGQWLALDSHTRQAVRESRQTDSRQKAADLERQKAMFPNMFRIR